jgi:hypothetical protein
MAVSLFTLSLRQSRYRLFFRIYALGLQHKESVVLIYCDAEFKAGKEIGICISAPYVGSGLITIEKDKIYANKFARDFNS